MIYTASYVNENKKKLIRRNQSNRLKKNLIIKKKFNWVGTSNPPIGARQFFIDRYDFNITNIRYHFTYFVKFLSQLNHKNIFLLKKE